MPRPTGPALALLEVRAVRSTEAVVRLQDHNRVRLALALPKSGTRGMQPVLDLKASMSNPTLRALTPKGSRFSPTALFGWAKNMSVRWLGSPQTGRSSRGSCLRVSTARCLLSGTAPRFPAIAAQRHLNRGFEAVAISTIDRLLYLAFQSRWPTRQWRTHQPPATSGSGSWTPTASRLPIPLPARRARDVPPRQPDGAVHRVTEGLRDRRHRGALATRARACVEDVQDLRVNLVPTARFRPSTGRSHQADGGPAIRFRRAAAVGRQI